MPWAERTEAWHQIDVAYCEVTGQLLPRRHWVFRHGDREIKARDPRCEELFRRYFADAPPVAEKPRTL
jgi:hypothetical protein